MIEAGKAVVDVEASPTLAMLSAAAKEAGVYLVGGEIPVAQAGLVIATVCLLSRACVGAAVWVNRIYTVHLCR